MAFSDGDGTFTVTNETVPSFPAWGDLEGVKVFRGDFDGDGLDDLGLVRPSGTQLPVALSAGNGQFTVHSQQIGSFAEWARRPNVRIMVGHFDNDTCEDIALTGPNGWGSMPVAFSDCDGSFTVTNHGISGFATWASLPDTVVKTGDFDGDGLTDVALTGAPGWGSIPVALSDGDGTFTVVNGGNNLFAQRASDSHAVVLAGDFNGDGRTDLALTGGLSWTDIPEALSDGDGTFTVSTPAAPDFAEWTSRGATPIIGKYGTDDDDDIALIGIHDWGSIPVAYGLTAGFSVVNHGVSGFAGWSGREGADAL